MAYRIMPLPPIPPRREELDLRPVEGPGADEELAALANAIAHPARVRILRLLAGSEAGPRSYWLCGELVEALGLAQSTVSQHLRVLKDAGLVFFDVDGPRSRYRTEPRALRRLRALLGSL